MSFNVFGKNSGNKDSLPATNPQQSTKQTSSILGATGFAFKSNNSGLKSFSTEKIFNRTKSLKLPIDEGIDSSEDEDDETTGSDSSDDSDTRVEQVKPKSNVLNKKNKLVNNVNDIQDDKASPIINKKPHATNIISDFSNFEFHSKLRALGGRAGNENNSQSEISFGNKKSNSNKLNTTKSDFVSGPTANPRIKANNMMSTEEQSYNRSDIRSDVSWGSDPGQQQPPPPPQVKSPAVKVNPNFIIESQNFTPNIAKLPHYNNNNVPSYHHTNTNEWNTNSFDSRSEIMYRGKDKMVSSRYNNSIARNPRLNSLSPGIPKTMSDVTYQPKELRNEVSHYDSPEYSSYGRNFNQRKPTVQLSARIPHSIDESTPFYSGARIINQQQQQQQHKPKVFVEPQRRVASFAQLNKEDEENDDNPEQNEEKDEEIDEEPDEEIEELMNMTDDENIQRKLLELHLSNKELLTLNKSLEENINEQSSELENFSSFDSMLKTQKEQLEHITNLENIIKDLTTKLSEQETQIKIIKDGDGDEKNKKSNATLFYDPRNLPLHTLPRIIFDRVYDDLNILYLVIKSLLYTFYIFPILIFFRVTKKAYEKSKTKFIEITTE